MGIRINMLEFSILSLAVNYFANKTILTISVILKMKNLIQLLSTILLFTSIFALSCTAPQTEESEIEINTPTNTNNMNPNFVHVVYFWLKNPDNVADRKAFETAIQKFMDTSEYAQTKFVGKPAMTPRDVVDNSYTYSLICSFDSKEDQDKYQSEPVHLKFVEDAAHLWTKVQVYDSVGL